MNRKNKNDDHKVREQRPSTKKKDNLSSKPEEDFNTGSHSPSSLRNVGPGYDDTGRGNDLRKSGGDNKNSAAPKKNKQKENSHRS